MIVIFPLILLRGCHNPESQVKYGTGLKSGVMIKVYFGSKSSVGSGAVNVDAGSNTGDMDLEEYLLGVVAAEMPAYFEMEALKAQAVAARIYAYGRLIKEYGSSGGHPGGADICTNPGHCQAWVDKAARKVAAQRQHLPPEPPHVPPVRLALAAIGQGPPDAQDADRADGRREGEPDGKSAQKEK